MSLILVAIVCFSFSACGKTMCSVEGCENNVSSDTSSKNPLCDYHLSICSVKGCQNSKFEDLEICEEHYYLEQQSYYSEQAARLFPCYWFIDYAEYQGEKISDLISILYLSDDNTGIINLGSGGTDFTYKFSHAKYDEETNSDFYYFDLTISDSSAYLLITVPEGSDKGSRALLNIYYDDGSYLSIFYDPS